MVPGFYKKHSALQKSRLGENVKNSRVAVSREKIDEYFNNLDISLSDTPKHLGDLIQQVFIFFYASILDLKLSIRYK